MNLGQINIGLPRWHSGRESTTSPANAGEARDTVLIPGSGRSSRGGNVNPFQYSCLENPMLRGAWWATVRGVAKSWTGLSTHTLTHTDLRKPPREAGSSWNSSWGHRHWQQSFWGCFFYHMDTGAGKSHFGILSLAY